MSFIRQLKVLIWKNWLIKRRNTKDTILEYSLPIALALIIAVINLVFPSTVKKEDYEARVAFYSFNFILTSAVPLLFANTCRFIMFQVVKEKELKIFSTLSTLNLSSSTYGLSYFFVQSINCVYTAICITIPNISLLEDKANTPLFFLSAFLFGEAMICFSLAITAIFNDSKFSTQIGFLTLFLPIFIYIGIFVFIQGDRSTLLYALSWLPHVPCMRLMQVYLDSYFDKEKKEVYVDQLMQFILLIVNIIAWFLIFMYLNSVLSIGKSPLFCLKCQRKKTKDQQAKNSSQKSLNDLNESTSTY